MALVIEYHRLIAPSRPWLLGGLNELAGTLQLPTQAKVSYPDGSLDTLPSLTLALLPDGVTNTFDWVHDRWIGYTVKGSNVLSVVKESLLASLDGNICPLTWIHDDECHPWQPYQVGTLTPVIPTISGALCGSTEVGFEPTITWTSVPGATDYELEVGTDPTFATSFIDVTVSGSTTYTVVTPLSAATVYYVRVRETAPAESDWSPSCSFTTGLFDDVPHILYPPDTSTQIYLAPLYQWTGVTGATSYEIEVATDPGFIGIVFDEVVGATLSYQFPLYIALTMAPPGSTMPNYWVRARVAAPAVGSWGPANAFETYALSVNAGDCGGTLDMTGHFLTEWWVAIYTDDPTAPAYGKPQFEGTDWTLVLFIDPSSDIKTNQSQGSPIMWSMGPSGSITTDIFGNGPQIPANAGALSARVASDQANSPNHSLPQATHLCVALVVDGAVGHTMDLYINGALVGTAGHAGGVVCPRMGIGYAGFAGGGPDAFQPFIGKVRNVQFYQNKLSGADIMAITATQLPIATASSVLNACWPMDEGGGTLVHDICTSQTVSGRDGIWADGMGHWTLW